MHVRFRLVVLALVLMLWTAVPSAHAAACSGSSCTGQDPATSGCGDGYAIAMRDVVDETSMVLGSVALLYSPTCESVWAEVFSYYGPTHAITASVTAPDSTTSGCSTTPPWVCYGGQGKTLAGPTYITSPMQYTLAPGDAMACGTINVTYTSIWGAITTQQSTCTL